jgi:hypothetical protein
MSENDAAPASHFLTFVSRSAERFVQPVVDPGIGQASRWYLTMGAGAFDPGETHQRLAAGGMIVAARSAVPFSVARTMLTTFETTAGNYEVAVEDIGPG